MKIERKNVQIDATGRAPGRIATEVARLLIGKHRADYQPNFDMGEIVEVINAGKMVITGKKIEQKVYRRHSGFSGGLKEKTLKVLWETSPEEVLKRSISRMLPKNKLRNERLKRLTITK
jgi:large subunit ribosomal protein L13